MRIMDDKQLLHLSSAEAPRSFGRIQTEASERPVIITNRGAPSLVVMSYEAWQEAEARTREKLLLVLDQTEEAYLSLDAKWRCLTVNRAAEMYFGRTREEMAGVTLGEAFPAIVGTSAERQIRRAMDQGEAVTFPWQSVLHSGRSLTVRVFPLPRRTGGVGILFSGKAEIERLRADRDAERDRNRALMGELPDWALIGIDRDGAIFEWSDAATRLLGWTAEEMIGSLAEDLYTEIERERGSIWSAIAQTRREGRSETVRVQVAKGGREVRCRDILVPLESGEGSYLKILRPIEEGEVMATEALTGRREAARRIEAVPDAESRKAARTG